MKSISKLQSIETEKNESKLAGNGSYHKSALTVFGNKVYLGDGREGLSKGQVLVDSISGYAAGKIAGAAGRVDEFDKLRIYGDMWYQLYEDYRKINNILVQYPYMTASQIAGAAGEEALTNYETIRKTAKMVDEVSGQQRILEDLNAIKIAKQITTQDFKHEFLRKTSAVLTADKELPDDQTPGDIRPAFAVGTHEIFADGTSYKTNLRDKELKIDVAAEIAKEIPGMFAQTKEDKVIAILNALGGTNQGDWDARDGLGIFTTRAAQEVDVAIAAVKPYGGPFVTLMPSDTFRLYEDNVGETYLGQKPGNKTTEEASALSGFLRGNPQVQYFINDSLTSQSYVLAAQNAYLKYIQGMVIKTAFKDVRTSGQTEWTFHFDFNGFFENEVNSVFKGLTVGA